MSFCEAENLHSSSYNFETQHNVFHKQKCLSIWDKGRFRFNRSGEPTVEITILVINVEFRGFIALTVDILNELLVFWVSHFIEKTTRLVT